MGEFVDLAGQDVECRVCGATIPARVHEIEDHMQTHSPSEIEHAAVQPKGSKSMTDDTQDPTAEIEEMEQQQRRIQPTPSLNGTQIAFLAIYLGLSGVAGVAASTLFDSLLRQLAAGLSAAVLTFGVVGLVGLYVFGSGDGK